LVSVNAPQHPTNALPAAAPTIPDIGLGASATETGEPGLSGIANFALPLA